MYLIFIFLYQIFIVAFPYPLVCPCPYYYLFPFLLIIWLALDRGSTPSSSFSERSGFGGGLALHPVLHYGGNRFAFDVMFAPTTIQFHTPVNINEPATMPPKARIGLNFITHPHWAFMVTAANPSIGVTLSDVFTAVFNTANRSASDQDWQEAEQFRYTTRPPGGRQYQSRRYECLTSRYFIGLTLSQQPPLAPGVEVWDIRFAPATRA